MQGSVLVSRAFPNRHLLAVIFLNRIELFAILNCLQERFLCSLQVVQIIGCDLLQPLCVGIAPLTIHILRDATHERSLSLRRLLRLKETLLCHIFHELDLVLLVHLEADSLDGSRDVVQKVCILVQVCLADGQSSLITEQGQLVLVQDFK